MTENHPITPPPELLQQWATEYWGNPGESIGEGEKYIAIQAARWGADQELETCVEWMRGSLTPFMPDQAADQLRAARRPKSPSFAEDALKALQDQIDTSFKISSEAQERADLIRAALERLQELETGDE
jgi:hypothetical protein